MKYTYLLIDLFALLIPFIYSFDSRIKFHLAWKAFFPAVLLSGLIYLAGDVLYTHWGVWGFNPDYLTGIYIINLPVEELLFFFCIPYACVFTYYCFNKLVSDEMSAKAEKLVTLPLLLFLLVMSVIFFDRLYTFAAMAGLAALLILIKYVFRSKWIGKFYIVYAVLLIPFMIVNGLLTGTGLSAPVVWYDDLENMGFRILSIPFEDIFYGMSLILLNVLIFEFISAKFPVRIPDSGKAVPSE